LKEFYTFEQQITYLESQKLLVISDRDFAKVKLEQIGYFNLITGYKDAFKNPVTDKFKDGTRFEEILALYEFDVQLRELFLRFLLQAERHFRSLIAYYFSDKHGGNQTQYLNAGNFTKSPKRANNVKKLIKKLNWLANISDDYSYITHHRTKYGNVPLWILMSGMTFGSMAKFYGLSETDLRTKVSKHFSGVNETQIDQSLSLLTNFRNVCAHGERLFSHQARNPITDMPIHAKLDIPKRGTQYVNGKQDLFAVVISLRYLLVNEEFKIFKNNLMKIIRYYLSKTTVMSEQELLSMMGFPQGWKRVTRYKK
jgi:abortive infection bacteriophage resistance protein